MHAALKYTAATAGREPGNICRRVLHTCSTKLKRNTAKEQHRDEQQAGARVGGGRGHGGEQEGGGSRRNVCGLPALM